MLNLQNLPFSVELSKERLARFQSILGLSILKRILCFALYLLGASRRRIAESIQMKPETAKSFLKALQRDGLPAFEDRRRRFSSFLPSAKLSAGKAQIHQEDERIIVDFGSQEKSLWLPRGNLLQVRVVLLSLLESGLLERKDVAACLGWSRVHTYNQAKKLRQEGVNALIDKRGQKKEYVVNAEAKEEIVQQFVLDVVRKGKTSGRLLSEELQERCGLKLSGRTVRHHLEKLGLWRIKHSLPQLLATLKKNSKTSSQE